MMLRPGRYLLAVFGQDQAVMVPRAGEELVFVPKVFRNVREIYPKIEIDGIDCDFRIGVKSMPLITH